MLVPCSACHTGSRCDRAGSSRTCSCWPWWSRWSTSGCGSSAGSDERRDQNTVVSARLAEPPVPARELLDARPAAPPTSRAVANRRVTVSGTYEPDEQVLVRSRSLDGSPGSWVLTPLRPSGRVDRRREPGLDPQRRHLRRRPAVLRPGRGDGAGGGAPPGEPGARGLRARPTPPSGRLTSLARVDVERYARAARRSGRARLGAAPCGAPAAGRRAATCRCRSSRPSSTSGPHFSYAVQWFIFSTIAIVGYPLILRRNAREQAGGDDDDPDEPIRPQDDERPGRWEGVKAALGDGEGPPGRCARWRPGPCWPRRRRWSCSASSGRPPSARWCRSPSSSSATAGWRSAVPRGPTGTSCGRSPACTAGRPTTSPLLTLVLLGVPMS